MPGHLLLKNCVEGEVTRPAIERALMQDTLLWRPRSRGPWIEGHPADVGRKRYR